MRENSDPGTGWIDRQEKPPADIGPLGNNQESAGKMAPGFGAIFIPIRCGAGCYITLSLLWSSRAGKLPKEGCRTWQRGSIRIAIRTMDGAGWYGFLKPL